MKTCRRCGVLKTLQDFRIVHKKYRDSICRTCRRIEHKEWYEKNKEREREKTRNRWRGRLSARTQRLSPSERKVYEYIRGRTHRTLPTYDDILADCQISHLSRLSVIIKKLVHLKLVHILPRRVKATATRQPRIQEEKKDV